MLPPFHPTVVLTIMHAKLFHLFQTSLHPPYFSTSIHVNMGEKWVYKDKWRHRWWRAWVENRCGEMEGVRLGRVVNMKVAMCMRLALSMTTSSERKWEEWVVSEKWVRGVEREMGMKGGHVCMAPMHAWSFMYMENGREWIGEKCMAEMVMEGDEGNGFKRRWKVGMKMGSGYEWCMS